MTDLTLTQRFGTNATYNQTNQTLTINLNDLTSIVVDGVDVGLDISGITAANVDEYASKIFWSLLLLNQANQPAINNDETVGIYVTNQGRRDAIRNSIAQIGYQLVTTAYQNNPLPANLDPDNIGS